MNIIKVCYGVDVICKNMYLLLNGFKFVLFKYFFCMYIEVNKCFVL